MREEARERFPIFLFKCLRKWESKRVERERGREEREGIEGERAREG